VNNDEITGAEGFVDNRGEIVNDGMNVADATPEASDDEGCVVSAGDREEVTGNGIVDDVDKMYVSHIEENS